MNDISGPQDVYKCLVEEAPEGWLLGLLAFAVLEEQRIDWMRHVEAKSGVATTSDQVRTWYEQLPSSALDRARGNAENVLNAYAQEVTRSIDEGYKRAAMDGVVVAEIRSSSRFWPKFLANVAAGLVGTLMFSVLLVLIVLVALRDPSPVAIIKQVQEAQRVK
ncbi:hypothetical protein [Stenotrophomonas sp. PD6]|uniref:hypothetical protein n=1 Tax=Stenotrophomonas sp. PD6 TaxID=3368612 RepID=UPI003B9DCF34